MNIRKILYAASFPLMIILLFHYMSAIDFMIRADRGPLTASIANMREISNMLMMIDESEKRHERWFSGEYWWLDEIKAHYPGYLERRPYSQYAPFDREWGRLPSSYIANPRLSGVDFLDEKVVPHPAETILLMEREPFFTLGGKITRIVIFADFSIKHLNDEETARYMDW